jgi:hypothetical protein
MKGEEIKDEEYESKDIVIKINPLLENERLEDFVNNYLVPFMQQLQVPVLNVTINE